MKLNDKSGLILFPILLTFSICFNPTHSSDVKVKPSKIDARFSKSREYINLLTTCTSTSSIRYRETRRMVMCNPPNLPMGIPLGVRHIPYRYSLEIIGKPESQFTIKDEPHSAHNSYAEYEMLNFELIPVQCKEYSITNLGDGVKNSRIILKLNDVQRPKCNERKMWLDQQQSSPSNFLSNPQMLKAMRTILMVTLKWQNIKGINYIINTYWPEEKPNLWEEITSTIKYKLKEADLARVNETSRQHINSYRDKLKDLRKAMNIGTANIENLIMSISIIFVGNENFLMFEDTTISTKMLPVFTAAMSLFINFHSLAIAWAEEYGFHSDNVVVLEDRRQRLVDRAHQYMVKVYDANLEYAFDTCDLSSNFYNCMVDAHNQIIQDGIQFLPLWRSLSGYKSNDSRLHDPLFYSHSYGVPTTELIRSAMFHSTNVFSAITPPFANHGCDKNSTDEMCFERMNANHIYVTYSDELKRISQMWFSTEEKDMSEFSANMWDTFTLQDNDPVESILVGGDESIGKIDYIRFYMSSGKIRTVGYIDYRRPNYVQKEVTFAMEGCFIAQARILNDDVQFLNRQRNPAKNMVVSYRLSDVSEVVEP